MYGYALRRRSRAGRGPVAGRSVGDRGVRRGAGGRGGRRISRPRARPGRGSRASGTRSVAPIAAEVAQLRGLDVRAPGRRSGISRPRSSRSSSATRRQPSAADRAEISSEEAVFRALGFIGGKVDLSHAVDTSQKSSDARVLRPVEPGDLRPRHDARRRAPRHDRARADPRAPGSALRPAEAARSARPTRRPATRGAEGARRGRRGADRTGLPRAALEPADQKEYDREDAAEGDRVGKETASVPDIVERLVGRARTSSGPSTVRGAVGVGRQRGGRRRADRPEPPSSGVFIAAGDVTPAGRGRRAAAPAGGVAEGGGRNRSVRSRCSSRSRCGSTRARALRPPTSSPAVEAVTFRQQRRTCYRVERRPDARADRPAFLGARSGTGRRAGQDRGSTPPATSSGSPRAIRARRAPAPSSQRLDDGASSCSGVRTGLTVERRQGRRLRATSRVAWPGCSSRRPAPKELVLAIGNGTPTGRAERRAAADRSAASAQLCRADPTPVCRSPTARRVTVLAYGGRCAGALDAHGRRSTIWRGSIPTT